MMKKIILLLVAVFFIYALSANEDSYEKILVSLNGGAEWQEYSNMEEFTEHLLIRTYQANEISVITNNPKIEWKFNNYQDYIDNLIIITRKFHASQTKVEESSIEDLNANINFNLFPIPANDKINVKIDKYYIVSYQIYNNKGILIANSSEILNTGLLNINTTDFPMGYYELVLFCNDDIIISKKFLISR
jgi:hypothetical protein